MTKQRYCTPVQIICSSYPNTSYFDHCCQQPLHPLCSKSGPHVPSLKPVMGQFTQDTKWFNTCEKTFPMHDASEPNIPSCKRMNQVLNGLIFHINYHLHLLFFQRIISSTNSIFPTNNIILDGYICSLCESTTYQQQDIMNMSFCPYKIGYISQQSITKIR